jgi:hypothetical protein
MTQPTSKYGRSVDLQKLLKESQDRREGRKPDVANPHTEFSKSAHPGRLYDSVVPDSIRVSATLDQNRFFIPILPGPVLRILCKGKLPGSAWPVFLIAWRRWTKSGDIWIAPPHADLRHMGVSRYAGYRALLALARARLVLTRQAGPHRAIQIALHPLLQAALPVGRQRRRSR